MMHIRVDTEELNSKRRFECGIGPELPLGDKYVFAEEFSLHHLVDCPGCLHGKKPQQLGTPLSELSGRPGQKGYAEFVRIAESWGHP